MTKTEIAELEEIDAWLKSGRIEYASQRLTRFLRERGPIAKPAPMAKLKDRGGK